MRTRLQNIFDAELERAAAADRFSAALETQHQLAAEGSMRAARGLEGGAAGALARQVELLFPLRPQGP
jgi:hypothetical protein